MLYSLPKAQKRYKAPSLAKSDFEITGAARYRRRTGFIMPIQCANAVNQEQGKGRADSERNTKGYPFDPLLCHRRHACDAVMLDIC